MALVNMQQSAEEATELTSPEGDAPLYPYGLELRLDEEQLGKLGMSAPPPVGVELMIRARVLVTSASQYQSIEGEPEASSCWQITDMEVAPMREQGEASSILYGS